MNAYLILVVLHASMCFCIYLSSLYVGKFPLVEQLTSDKATVRCGIHGVIIVWGLYLLLRPL